MSWEATDLVVGDIAFTVSDADGNALGTGSGAASPIVVVLAADKVPTAASFALTGTAAGTGQTTLFLGWSGDMKFDFS